MNKKSKAGSGSDGNTWERAGEGLCRAAVVGKRHEDAWSRGKLRRLLDCQVEKESFLCLKPQGSGAVCERAIGYCLRNGNGLA